MTPTGRVASTPSTRRWLPTRRPMACCSIPRRGPSKPLARDRPPARTPGNGAPTALFAGTRAAGPSRLDGEGAFDQPGVSDHAAFMNGLAEEGLVLFAGPLAGTEQGRIRVLLIAE